MADKDRPQVELGRCAAGSSCRSKKKVSLDCVFKLMNESENTCVIRGFVDSRLIVLLHVIICRVTAAHLVVNSGMLSITEGIVVAGEKACVGENCETIDPPPFLTYDGGERKMCELGTTTTTPKPVTPPTGGTGDVCRASVRAC